MSTQTEESGYGLVTRTLHWAMFLLLGAQFLLGYSIDRADDLLEWAVDRWAGGEDGMLVALHVSLGIFILGLTVIRAVWRKVGGLPPWAPGLSTVERRVAHRIEQVLYATMFLIPLTGLALVLLSGDDWDLGRGRLRAPFDLIDDDLLLGAHIVAHLVFFGALAVHVGLVLKHQFVDRDGLLRRML
jgi:cytochrome b561